jgi:hypothetical protein
MVLPIKIPLAMDVGTVGEFIYFPNARRMPENEISNLIGRVHHKRFVSEKVTCLWISRPLES